jgi:pimeloyl-ACP methyl ester carboxylesterase
MFQPSMDQVTDQPTAPGSAVPESRSFHRMFDGVELHWVEYGESSERPPVVLLHGLNDSHLTWRQIAPGLACDRRVLVLDLPGHGFSGRPDAGYELAWYTKIVAHWAEHLGLDSVDVVGHSLGGGIALMLLAEGRPHIRRLVLAAPGGLGKEVSFVLRLALFPFAVEWFGQPFMALGTRLALRRLRARLPHRHIDDLSDMNARRGTARAFARTVRGLMDWRGQRHSFFLHAHEILALPPIAVLWGDSDSIIPIEHGRALARGVEGVRFMELAGCGHYLHHDDPKAFLQGVRDVLEAPSWPRMRLRAPSVAALATNREALPPSVRFPVPAAP